MDAHQKARALKRAYRNLNRFHRWTRRARMWDRVVQKLAPFPSFAGRGVTGTIEI